MIQFVEREEAHARVVGLRAEHAIELDGMTDGFVNLEAELAAVENQIEGAFGTFVGGVQCHGLFGDARRVLEQIDLVDQLVALELVLAAEGIRIRALLDLIVLEAVGFESGAAGGAGLIDDATDGRDEDLAAAVKDHGSLRECYAGSSAQFVVDRGEEGELFFDADREGIDLAGRDPGGFVLRFGRERDVVFLGEGAGVSDVDSERGRGFDAGAGEIVSGGESPAAVGEHADSDAGRLIARDLAGLAVLGAELAVATFDDADVRVGDAGALGGIERFKRQMFHRSSIAGWWVVGCGLWARRETFCDGWRKWGCCV